METAAKIYEEGKKANKEVVQVNPAWILEESLESLSFKFPILPRSQGSLIFCTTYLSNKLESKPEDALFDLSDTNVLKYNVLHDLHLKDYFQNREMRRRLVDQGFITEDGFVKCNLVEFNNYRKWIRKLKLEELHKHRMQQRREEIIQRNKQLMEKKMEREKESLYILREREQKAKEYSKKRKEKREIEKVKYLKLRELELRRKEKKKKERKIKLDDVEEQREKRQVERQVEKVIQEDKKRRIKLRIVYKRNKEDKRRECSIVEQRRLGRWQREREIKRQWKRRCTIALGNISEQWKEERRLLDVRERNIQRRAKMFEKRQKSNNAAVTNFVKTRRATLQQEFLQAEEFLNKLRMKKDIEIENWKRKHEKMVSKGLSSPNLKHKGSKTEGSDEFMALRRWSDPLKTGFRKRLKSTWDIQTSLIKDLEEESPPIARERDDVAKEKESEKDFRKTEERKRVHSLICNIINNAYEILEDDKRRSVVKRVVGNIIGSAVAIVEKEKEYHQKKTFIRRFVFSVIETACEKLERERVELHKAKLKEEQVTVEKVREQLDRFARELVSTAVVFAKQRVEKETSVKDDKELKDAAKRIVGETIDKACNRCTTQVGDIKRLSSDVLPENIALCNEDLDQQLSLDWAVRNIVSDAVATAVDSVERLYYKECDIMEAATALMKSAVINSKESFEVMYHITPALEEQMNRMAWKLTNRALISAENSLEKQREETIKQAAHDCASHALLSATNSLARMEEKILSETAEELAIQAIMSAQKSLIKSDEEEFFANELRKRAILEAKDSLVRADEIERHSRELAKQAIESAQAYFKNYSRERADEGKKIAVVAAERCIEVYKSQENLTTENKLIADEALSIAIEAIQFSDGLLKDAKPFRKTCVLTDGMLLSSVMQYVEGVIIRALQELDSNKGINVLKPGNVRPDEYTVLVRSDKDLQRGPLVQDGTSKPVQTNRRRSSVHFNAGNAFSSRRDSTSRESDFHPVRSRPPTPRFLDRRTFSNQRTISTWEDVEQKLKDIEQKDKVKILLSTNEDSQTSDMKRLRLRRFSSYQGIETKPRPVFVSFDVPHSASDSYFRHTSDSENRDVVKQMLASSNKSYTALEERDIDALDAKEHQDCEYDTLVSMTNTPEPPVKMDYEDDIFQKISCAEERIPCQIAPRASSYILLPKLESHENLLLQAKINEYEKVRSHIESSLTLLPSVHHTASLVVAQDADVYTVLERERAKPSTEEHMNLPIISKSGSLVSIDRESIVDEDRSKSATETETTSVEHPETDAAKISTKYLSEVTRLPLDATNDNVIATDSRTKLISKTSNVLATLSPKASSDKIPSSENVMVSPKQTSVATNALVMASSESAKMMRSFSTEAGKVAPAPLSESNRVLPTALSDSIKTPSNSSTKVSPKASNESREKQLVPTTEVAIISPKPSLETTALLLKDSSESKIIASITSAEAQSVSTEPSIEETKLSPKASKKSIIVVFPSTEEAKVSSKPPLEAMETSPKDSGESIKVTLLSASKAKTLVESSLKDVKVFPNASSTSMKMRTVSSHERAQVSPKSSHEFGKPSFQASKEENTKTVSSKPCQDDSEGPSKASNVCAKMTPVPSNEVGKQLSITMSESAILPDGTLSGVNQLSPTSSAEVIKVSSIVSSGVAVKLSTESSNAKSQTNNCLPKASSESSKIKSTSSNEKAKVTEKLSSQIKLILPASRSTPVKSTEWVKSSATTLLDKTLSESKKLSCKLSLGTAPLPLNYPSEATKPSEKIAAIPQSSEATKLSPNTKNASTTVPSSSSAEIATIPSKQSSEAIKLSPKMSKEHTKVPSKPSAEIATVPSKQSGEAIKLSPKMSKECTEVPFKPSGEIATIPSKQLGEAAKMSPKTSSASTKEPSESYAEMASIPSKQSSEAAKLSPKISKESKKVSSKSSAEIATIPSKQSSKATILWPKTSKDSTKVPSKSSAEIATIPSKQSSKATILSPKTSKDSTKVPSKSSAEKATISSKQSTEAAKLSSRTSRTSTKVPFKPSAEDAKVLLKSSTDSIKPSPSASETCMKTANTPSSNTLKVSPRPSSETAEMFVQTSSEPNKFTSITRTESILSPKSSTEAAKLSQTFSSVSATVTPKSSAEAIKAAKLPIKTSTERTKVSSKPLTDSTELLSKTTSSTSPKMSPKPSQNKTKVSPKHSNESSAKITSTISTDIMVKESLKSSSSELKKVTNKSSQETLKGAAKSSSDHDTTPPSLKDSRESAMGTSKASHEDLSLKRLRESSILPSKVSRESKKKKTKHSRRAAKVSKKPGETVQIKSKSSSQSTKITTEASPKSSQVSRTSSSDVAQDISKFEGEFIDLSSKTSFESAKMSKKHSKKDATKTPNASSEEKLSDTSSGKLEKMPSTESKDTEVMSSPTDSPGISHRRTSRKASKAKPMSLSLTKVSLKTHESPELQASVSASVVSTYLISKPPNFGNKNPVENENTTVSLKSLAKIETQSPLNGNREGLQEKTSKIQTESQSQLPLKDISDTEDRRISLSVPDPVVALKGIGRRTSLPGGPFSEHDLEKRRLSSLQDICESKGINAPDSSAQDQDMKEGKKRTDIENCTALSFIHSIPDITIKEPSSPPNEDNVLFEESERKRIILELEHIHPNSSDQILIDNGASERKETNIASDLIKTSDATVHNKSSIADVDSENYSDKIKVRKTSADIVTTSQTGGETPKRQSLPCVGIQFSPTSSKEDTFSNRFSDASLKTKRTRRSGSKISTEGLALVEPLHDSFELKGVGLGGGSSSLKDLIISRSTEFRRIQPLQGSRCRFSSHSLDMPLSRGVIITPLKPSPPLSPRLIESSARRSRLKMALSQQGAKETQSETSLSSSKSNTSEGSPKKASGILRGSDSSVNSSIDSRESLKTLERPNTAFGILKREKVKASRAVISSSSNERSDREGRGNSDAKLANDAM